MQTRTLYLLDHQQAVRAGLCLLAQSWGYPVVGESGDPTEALADIRRLSPHVVLLGIDLAQQSGLTLLAGLKAHQAHSACVVFTGSQEPQHLAQALRLGAAGYVLKTSSAEELRQALAAAMEGKHYLCKQADQLAAQALCQGETGRAEPLLSWREHHIARLVVQGYSSRAIGELLHLSPKTVATYRSRTMRKLGVNNVCELMRLAWQLGWLDASAKTS